MPREIKTREEFEKLLPSALEIRVVRPRSPKEETEEESKDEEEENTVETATAAKIKIRTATQLYTYKASEDEVESLVKGAKAEVFEY